MVSKGDYIANLYSHFYTKMTIDRKTCPNLNDVQRIKPQTQCSNIYVLSQCTGKPHSEYTNIQRKYSGSTKEECHSYIMSMHKRTNAQENHTECTKKIHWMYKGKKCHSDSINAQMQTTQSNQNVLIHPSIQLCDREHQ